MMTITITILWICITYFHLSLDGWSSIIAAESRRFAKDSNRKQWKYCSVLCNGVQSAAVLRIIALHENSFLNILNIDRKK